MIQLQLHILQIPPPLVNSTLNIQVLIQKTKQAFDVMDTLILMPI